MKTILVTGSEGFLGRNLCVALDRCEGIEVLRFDIQNSEQELEILVKDADFIFHLAGVNRPKDENEFAEGNTDLTRQLCDFAATHSSKAPIMLSSSTQATGDNAYGMSKKRAEDLLIEYSQDNGVPVLVYRFPNLFGKWSKPNYNSVVSTFCHNIAHGQKIQINDPSHVVTFAYVDDVVDECLMRLDDEHLKPAENYYSLAETYDVSLGELAGKIREFHAVRNGKPMPDLSNPFCKKLYATFLSYYESTDFAYPVDLKTDDRGWLFEFIKSKYGGQIFISKTYPGITRGNHGHNTKIEKFCVIQGEGTIRFRHVCSDELFSYEVSGEYIKIVDIPPGYTHSIENTGTTDMITLFWANEIFDPEKPDTYFDPVLKNEE